MMQAMCEIKKLYREIYHNGHGKTFKVWKHEGCDWKVEEKEFNRLAHFVPMEGTHYRENTRVKMLVIGRAVNGWPDTEAVDEQNYGDWVEASIFRKGFDWVVEEKGTLYNKNDNGTKGDYRVSSPFWNITKSIFEYLNRGPAENPKWVEYIAWTNLYKIAPTHTGNPEGPMKEIQKKQCIELLKHEIQYYSPTHILALTGWEEWMDEFKEIFDADSVKVHGKNIVKGQDKNSIYLEAQGTVGGIPVAIACRPEFRPKEEYIADVMKAFNTTNCD